MLCSPPPHPFTNSDCLMCILLCGRSIQKSMGVLLIRLAYVAKQEPTCRVKPLSEVWCKPSQDLLPLGLLLNLQCVKGSCIKTMPIKESKVHFGQSKMWHSKWGCHSQSCVTFSSLSPQQIDKDIKAVHSYFPILATSSQLGALKAGKCMPSEWGIITQVKLPKHYG